MYLTLLIITNPLIAANNRGENEGNLQTLQKVKTREGMRTVLSGYTLKRAMRDNMQANGASMWRKTVANPGKENPAGYGYGPKDVPAMADALPATATEYDDTLLFGYMVAKKGASDNATKQRGNVEVSNAISTTPYDGDTAFAQGLKADGPALAPFSWERHYTRYQFTVTVNLAALAARPDAFRHFLESLRGLRVGGSHGSNASEITPAVLAWRFHKAPGRGGLYLGAGMNFLPDVPVDLSALKAHCANLGVTDYDIAGVGLEKSVARALEEIQATASSFMDKL